MPTKPPGFPATVSKKTMRSLMWSYTIIALLLILIILTARY